MRAILEGLNAEADVWFEAAGSSEIKNALRAQTDEAIDRGIFGAPSFTIDGELFWGNDRLEAGNVPLLVETRLSGVALV